MKVVVFAQTPPPHHGQSYMVELMIRGFAKADYGIAVFHVNAQFGTSATDVGKFRAGKVFRLFGYCLKALWLRFRHGAANLYYVPAPPVKTPLYRDWAVLIFLKPFFRRLILHWHSAGLGEWLQSQPKWMQRLTRLALAHNDLSISLGRFNEKDAAWFDPQRSVVVPNGIPDPCPNFTEVLAARRQRMQVRSKGSNTRSGPVRVLFLSLCSKEKGVFDAIEGVVQANRLCQSQQLSLEFELTIAGSFLNVGDEQTFRETQERLGHPKTIRHVGFVAGEEKTKLLAESDIFCFPTFYYGENLSVVILEAMAFGLPILTTKWRSLPDLFPANYPGLVDIQAPEQIVASLLILAARDDAEEFRMRFLQNYTADKFLEKLAKAFKEAA